MNISVIIPVYNAGRFIKPAVESALNQPEVKEIIIVEDGSSDNSLSVCKSLAKIIPAVRLFQHPKGLNLGAGATRNLGMKMAQYEYISFLDADDCFLTDRFLKTKETFKLHQDADGVYEAIGVKYHDKEAEEIYKKKFKNYNAELTTVTDKVPPELLHESLICKKKFGWFTLDGLTIKTKVLKIVGDFNPKISIGQDTDFIHRLSYYCKLYPGEINKPVALRGVHNLNRILNKEKHENSKKTFVQNQIKLAKQHNYKKHVNRKILMNFCSTTYNLNKTFRKKNTFKLALFLCSTFYLLSNPNYIRKVI